MLCLDPSLRFRKAESSVLCYGIQVPGEGVFPHEVLHPLEAVTLSLFNSRRTIGEIDELLAQSTGTSRDQCHTFVSRVVGKRRRLLVDGKANDHLGPLDVMMPGDDIDMEHFRLISPLQLVLLLTYRCSSDCLYCYANRHSLEDVREMDLDLAMHVVDEAADCEVELIFVGGGDPFAKPWIVELVRYILASGIAVIISTKELLPRTTTDGLVDAGLRTMQVSIDTLDDSTAGVLSGRNGFLAEITQTIDNLAASGIDVTTNTVITGHNCRQIPQLVEWLITKDVTRIMLSRYYRSTYHHSDECFVSDEDIAWLSGQVSLVKRPPDCYIYCPKAGGPVPGEDERLNTYLKRSSCAVGRMGLVVTPSAKVIPCEQLPTRAPFVLGDLRTESLRDIWNSDALSSLMYPPRSRFTGTACTDCEHFEECIHRKGWCIRDVHKLYGTDVGVPPNCPKSNHNMRLT